MCLCIYIILYIYIYIYIYIRHTRSYIHTHTSGDGSQIIYKLNGNCFLRTSFLICHAIVDMSDTK